MLYSARSKSGGKGGALESASLQRQQKIMNEYQTPSTPTPQSCLQGPNPYPILLQKKKETKGYYYYYLFSTQSSLFLLCVSVCFNLRLKRAVVTKIGVCFCKGLSLIKVVFFLSVSVTVYTILHS